MLEYIVVWIKRVYKRVREPSDRVLVIGAVSHWIWVVEEFRIVRRGVNVWGTGDFHIFRI
jgi:hypothetical protein